MPYSCPDCKHYNEEQIEYHYCHVCEMDHDCFEPKGGSDMAKNEDAVLYCGFTTYTFETVPSTLDLFVFYRVLINYIKPELINTSDEMLLYFADRAHAKGKTEFSFVANNKDMSAKAYDIMTSLLHAKFKYTSTLKPYEECIEDYGFYLDTDDENEHRVYLCNIDACTDCPKTFCVKDGGPCAMTSKPECAWNKDKLVYTAYDIMDWAVDNLEREETANG